MADGPGGLHFEIGSRIPGGVADAGVFCPDEGYQLGAVIWNPKTSLTRLEQP